VDCAVELHRNLVEGKIIVELKSVERVTPAHQKQLLTDLRLAGMKLGYLLNFGEGLMREGRYGAAQWRRSRRHPSVARSDALGRPHRSVAVRLGRAAAQGVLGA
jgi:hypothetical protein